ncbi:hypothetical protein BN1013_02061 [Candidatus Rubidus massiliensis]|nr:hypothetical protein BN1013_02061 [Candidatus Rubidus massiliensis]
MIISFAYSLAEHLFYSFFVVLFFASIHWNADIIHKFDQKFKSILFSVGGGFSIAYVFLDLLPKLPAKNVKVTETTWTLIPYLERHVYIMALIGFVTFFAIDRSKALLQNRKNIYYTMNLLTYALFNFLIGYAVVDVENDEVQPLLLFTFAIGLHYLANDYMLTEEHGEEYRKVGKWILIASLVCGWSLGLFIQISETPVALISAYIGGGVIMNVTRHELSSDNPHNLTAFLVATFIYAFILLNLGVY